MMSWTGEEQPAPLKRPCASCGRAEHLDKLDLCDQCRDDFDREMEAIERNWDDDTARRIYYNG